FLSGWKPTSANIRRGVLHLPILGGPVSVGDLHMAGRSESGSDSAMSVSARGHLAELKIALDPSDPRRFIPAGIPEHSKVLDVGCGAGQTLIAACEDRHAFGLDIS